jgi:patatin-like phospholipase/acyl hydrolase
MEGLSTLPPFRVLALDGGGIRGLYTATLLDILFEYFAQESEGQAKTSLGKRFDLISGTSTGGILAMGLAAGIPLNTIISLYIEAGPMIFPHKNSLPAAGFGLYWWLLKFLKKPSAKQEALRKHLEDIFGDMTIGDIYSQHNIALCLPAVDAKTQQPVILKTPHHKDFKRDFKRKAVDACMATSAAPFYFPMIALPRSEATGHDVFVDGGLWANNPVLVGMVEALLLAKEGQIIQIISVGTCNPPEGQSYSLKECHRGVLSWGFGSKVLTLSLDAQSSGHAFIAQKLAPQLRTSCKIVRLPSNPPPAADAPHFGLDKAYPKALETLQNKAVSDAKVIQSKYRNEDPDMLLLASIFA